MMKIKFKHNKSKIDDFIRIGIYLETQNSNEV